MIPKVNSLVDNPDADRAATTADGPGMGTTGMLLVAHSLACITIAATISSKILNLMVQITQVWSYSYEVSCY